MSVKNKFLFTMTACTGPNPGDTRPIVHRPRGLPITAGCDTSWIRTRVSVVTPLALRCSARVTQSLGRREAGVREERKEVRGEQREQVMMRDWLIGVL